MFQILSGFGDINQHNMFPIFCCFTIPFKNILIVLSRYRPIFDGAFWTLWEPRQLHVILYAAAFCLYLLDNLKRAYYRQIQAENLVQLSFAIGGNVSWSCCTKSYNRWKTYDSSVSRCSPGFPSGPITSLFINWLLLRCSTWLNVATRQICGVMILISRIRT